MDSKEIRRIFYRDGYRLAHEHLGKELEASALRKAIVRLYLAVDGLLESFLARTSAEGTPAHCRKGCAWCCSQQVFAVTHEFFYLHEYVMQHFTEMQGERFLERAREKVLLTLNLPVEEQAKVRAACPFLDHGDCRVYEARPMACRIYLSFSVTSCKRDHEQAARGNAIPQLFEFPLLAGRMMNEGFMAYLKQAGIPSSELPMEQGYASMASMEQTMEDWIGSS